MMRPYDAREPLGGERQTRLAELAEQDDEALMLAFRDGATSALEVLFERHARGIRAFIFRMTANDSLAKDITQATFLSVVRGRDRFTRDSRVVPWLYTIALNALRDHQRRRKREQLTGDTVPPESWVRQEEPDPSLQRRVRAALLSLPDDQRQAVILHHVEGFAFRDAARIVGVSESAIKVRAHRGYERLRGLLGDMWRSIRDE